MNTQTYIPSTTHPKTLAGRLRTACARSLLPLLVLLALPAVSQAQFNYTTNNGTITITGYTGPGGAVTIPNVINGYPVTTIGLSAFESCTSLTSISIPNSVTSIETNAFYACTGLSSVTIPNSVTNVRMAAFKDCSNLASVTIGSGVATIGDWAFSVCSSLTNVTIPNSVTSIGHEAFGDSTNLTSITVDSLNSTYSSLDGVLFNKTQTTLVQYPAGIAATSYTIPNGVTGIGNWALAYCTGLTSVMIPDSVTSVGDGAFGWCTSLTNVTMGNRVTSIGDHAFQSCTRLTGVYCESNAPSLGGVYVFQGDNDATVYYLPGTTGWGATFGGLPTARWQPPGPGAWALSASTITTTSGTLNGTVNPNGFLTAAWFQWGTTTNYGNLTPASGMGSGTNALPLSASLAGLTPGVTYHYRVAATNSNGAGYSSDASFTTLGPPEVRTSAATAVTATNAMLNVTVNPNGYPTTAWFQWGTTTSYGNLTAATGMGSGTSDLPLSVTLAKLIPGTTYHFRAAATNIAGVVYGSGQSFITARAGGMVTNCTEADLRAAMAGGGTVTFACDGTITLASTITIAADTTLDASGHQITISGNNAVRVFYVNANVDFTLINLTVANGLCNDRGAGMLNDGGRVNLTGVTFTGNRVTVGYSSYTAGGTGRGGAICNLGQLTVQSSSFLTNQASGARGGDGCCVFDSPGGSGGSGLGGALDNQGTASIASSTFAGNLAYGGQGGTGVGDHGGGKAGAGGAGGSAIGAVSSQGSIGLVNCTFTSNGAYAGAGGNGSDGGHSLFAGVPGGAGGDGGAGGSAYSCLYIYGGAEITNYTAAGNVAQAGRGGSGGRSGAGYPGDLFSPPTADGPPGTNGPDGTAWDCFSRGPMIQGAPFFYTINNGSITTTGYTGAGGALTIPETINGLPVTSISFAFYNCTSLTSVTIPNSVTSIGSGAFMGCTNLTNVTISSSVKNIGDVAFDYCLSLTSITIPNSVTNIGDEAFQYCAGLTGVYFFGNAPSLPGPSVFAFDNNTTVYYLRGTTGWGTTYGGRPTALWVQVPAIQTPPQTQTGEAGSAVDLRADASSPLPLFYLWYLNNTNLISSSTNGGLALTGVQFSQSGAYTVVISNVLGAITSAPTLLNVIAPVERRPVPGVHVTGEPGSLLNLDYANFLTATPLWTTLGSVSLASTSQYYFDLTLPLPPRRFYRAWQTGTPGVSPSLDLHIVPAITLTGSIGHSVRVDAINQFGPTDAWFTLDTMTLTNASQLYFDVSARQQPPRLYRLVQVP